MAQQAFELEGVLEQFRMVLALVLEPRLHFERVLQRKITPLLGRRVKLDDLVGLAKREPKDPAHVANRLLALDGAEGDYLRDAVRTVFVAHVIQDLIAPFPAEIRVDIRHRLAARIEPSLEQQLMLDRIDFGDAKRVRDERSDDRSAARPGGNAPVAGVADEVLHDEHIAGKAHLSDCGNFAIEPLVVRGGIELSQARANLRQALFQSRTRAPLHLVFKADILVRLIDWKVELPELELEIHPPGDFHRVAEFLRFRPERLRHLVRRLDVQFVGIETPSRFVRHRLSGLDAEQDLVRLGVAAMEVVAIVGRDYRQSDLARDVAQRVIDWRMQAVVLKLDIEAIAESLRIPFGSLARLVHPALPEPSRNLAGKTAGKNDEPIRELGENFLVDARLVVEPFLVRGGQPLVAVLRENYEMEVAAALHVVAAGSLSTIGSFAGGEVCLASDYRLDAVGDGLLVELDRAEHVAMVGNRHRFHAAGFGVLEERSDFVGAIEQAELRMNMQMGETHRGSSTRRARRWRARPPLERTLRALRTWRSARVYFFAGSAFLAAPAGAASFAAPSAAGAAAAAPSAGAPSAAAASAAAATGASGTVGGSTETTAKS